MITFNEIPKEQIYNSHNNHYHDDARYFQITDDDKPLCIYGIISHGDGIAEAFWILDSFSKNVISKKFFKEFFAHLFTHDFKEIYTWTRCKKIINVFRHYKSIGIEEVIFPIWDRDETKTWFMKRI
jgi:hypothetical protein